MAAKPIHSDDGRLDRLEKTKKNDIRVDDGDSFWLGDYKIRLKGIDAPEARQECETSDPELKKCGQAALKQLKALLSASELVCKISRGSKQEPIIRYGRYEAECTANGKDVSDAMLAAGLAVAHSDYATSRHREIEQDAKDERSGIHATKFQRPIEYRRDRRRGKKIDEQCDFADDIS